ncbi:hypothetical protein HHK36_029562 [Tetracentron sinense]|uniref:Chalcone isomerase domain-containing protein n=1 Tax=Tetracentron sinense TaxID=13715 RepID=A0A835D2Q5_TETSI|nr:hypothetical protein HHK36_029562 [Tetracentron sinense]
MAPTVEEVTAKAGMVEIEPKTGVALKVVAVKDNNKTDNPVSRTDVKETAKEEKVNGENGTKAEVVPKEEGKAETEPTSKIALKEETEKEEVAVEIEPKTGVSFPVKLDDGKQLNSAGVRKKSILGVGLKIYSFGIYAENEKLKDLLMSKIGKAPTKPTKEMYQVVIDSDVGMMVRLVIVFSGLTMSMVRKNFDEGLGASIKKLTGGKNEELTNKMMGAASDDIKLTAGSVIEITKLPGYILQTKVKDEVVSKVESELLCRAYIYMYLGDDAFDKDAKEKFGLSLLSLF